MTVLAVQNQIQSYLNDLPVVGWANIDARVVQPVNDYMKVGTPLVFIWGAAAHETRVTIPRGPGWKQDAYSVGMWIYGVEQANDPDRSWKFPTLIQTVRNALATASPMPVDLTDPISGVTSQLLNLGEEFSWEYDVDRTLTDQRLIRNLCHLEVSVLEEFKA